jgi:hypothetical protein
MEKWMEGKATANYKEQKDTFAWQSKSISEISKHFTILWSVFAWCQMFVNDE